MSIIFSPYCCSGKEIGEQMFSKLLETRNILEFWGWQLFAVTELAVKAAAAAGSMCLWAGLGLEPTLPFLVALNLTATTFCMYLS